MQLFVKVKPSSLQKRDENLGEVIYQWVQLIIEKSIIVHVCVSFDLWEWRENIFYSILDGK